VAAYGRRQMKTITKYLDLAAMLFVCVAACGFILAVFYL
jgi:hypothetical protein